MPKKNKEDDRIEIYAQEEIFKMMERLRGTNYYKQATSIWGVYGTAYRNTEETRIRIKKEQDDASIGGDFINRKENGELLTTDSMKHWVKVINAELGIHLKYHNLRHCHASYLAAMNVPAVALQERLGHKKISTTYLYYISTNEIAKDKLIKAINQL